MKMYRAIHRLPAVEVSIELPKIGLTLTGDLHKTKKDAIEEARKWVTGIAVEEIGRGIIWVKTALDQRR